MSLLQNLGFHAPIKLADHVIVHTQAGKQTLVKHGIDPDKIAVIPHGPLKVHAQAASERPLRDPRWTFVLFGELKPYKGLDILVEAVGLLDPAVRVQAKVIIAGRERMDLAPIRQRIADLKLSDTIELRPQRLNDQEMADLFEDTDTFVFPYRQIDASGVYFLVKSMNRWVIASRVGIFAEDIREGEQGALIPLESPQALAQSMKEAIESQIRPAPLPLSGTWLGIGERTKLLYEQALSDRARLQRSLG
jgi:glycosyltransferase involved in cell wall biosynthesis